MESDEIKIAVHHELVDMSIAVMITLPFGDTRATNVHVEIGGCCFGEGWRIEGGSSEDSDE